MALKISVYCNLEVNVKGLCDTTALGDRRKHAYGRNSVTDCNGMLRVTIVRLRFDIQCTYGHIVKIM